MKRSISLLVLFAALASLLPAASQAAGNGTWAAANTSGNWEDATKWTGSTVAGGQGAIADFGSALNLTAIAYVTNLAASVTIGQLVLNDTTPSAHGFVFRGKPFIFDNGSGVMGVITVKSYFATGPFTMTNEVQGTSGIKKTGVGRLLWSGVGANTFIGGLTIEQGDLEIGNAARLGDNSVTFSGSAQLTETSAMTITNNIAINDGRTATNSNASAVTLLGVVSGGGNLYKLGAGTLFMTNNNTYKGTTTAGGGEIAADDGSDYWAVSSSNISFNAAVWVFGLDPAKTNITRAAGTGNNQVALAGGAAGFSAYTNDVTVNLGGAGGSLTWGNPEFAPSTLVLNSATAANKLTLANSINLNSAVRIIGVNGNPADATAATITGNITGNAPTLTINGGGLLVLNPASANTFNAKVLLASAGTILRADDGWGLSVSSNFSLAAGVLEFGMKGGSYTNFTRTPVLTAVGGASTITYTAGACGFSARGNDVVVSLGGLASPTALTFGTAPFALASLILNETTADKNLTFRNAINLNGLVKAITVKANTAEITGALTGAGTSGLTKDGAGTLVLSGANNLTGTGLQQITAGTLKIGSSSSTLSANGALTLATGGTLDMQSYNLSVGAVTLTLGTITGTGSATLTGTGYSVAAGTIDVILAGGSTVNLTKTGTTLVTLNGNNTYGGALTNQAGVLELKYLGNTANGAGTIVLGNLTTGAPTLRYIGTGSASTTRAINLSSTIGACTIEAGEGSGALTLGGNISSTIAGTKTLTLNASNAVANTASGAISGGTGVINLSKTGPGTWILTGGNSYGTTAITGGILQIGAGSTSGSLGTSATTVTAPGVLVFNRSDAVTYNQIISDTGAVTIDGGSSVTLSGVNIYDGDTTITNSSTLKCGVVNALPPAAADGNVVINTGCTLDLNGFSVGIGGLSGTGTVDNTSATAVVLTNGINLAANTYSGVIKNTGGGALSFTKAGATGILILSGSNTYDGATTIAGTLRLGASEVIPHGSGKGNVTLTTANTSILDLNGFNETINGFGATSPGLVSNSTGSATLTIGAADTAAASSSIVMKDSASTPLALTKTGAGTQTIGGIISISGPVTVDGGTLILGGANTYTNTTQINAGGILQITAAAKIPNASAVVVNGGEFNVGFIETVASVTLNSGSISGALTLTSTAGFEVKDGSITPILASGNGLTKTTSGTVTLGGASTTYTYTGPTVVNGGTLRILASDRIANTSTLNIDNGAVFDIGAYNEYVDAVSLTNGTISGTTGILTGTVYNVQSGTISAKLGGTAALNKSTSGIVTNSGTNTYSGATTISGGTLVVNGSQGSSAVTVADTATLSGGGTVGGITVSAGGTVNPGDAASDRTLTATSLALSAATSKCVFRIDSLSVLDQVKLGGGSFTYGSGGEFYLYESDGVTPFATPGGPYQLIECGNTAGPVTTLTTPEKPGNVNYAFSVVDGWLVVQVSGSTTWNGGSGTDANWTSDANWEGSHLADNAAPIFAGTTRVINTNTFDNYTLGGITFDAGDGAFVLRGNAISLAGNVVNNSASIQTIDLPMVLVTSPREINAAAGDVVVSQAIGSADDLGITKTGPSNLTLAAANTYTGLTTITAGAVNIRNDSALGSTLNGTTVSGDGAALQIQDGINTPEPITLNGNGIATDGALKNVAGANTVSGAILLGSASRIEATDGSLTIDVAAGKAIDAASGTPGITFAGAGDITVNDQIDYPVTALDKAGSGTLTLASSNTYAGVTTVGSGGAIVITHTNALGAIGAASNTVVNSGGALKISGSLGNIAAEPLTLNGLGIDQTNGALRNISGNSTNTGAITLGSDVRIHSDLDSTLTIKGGINGASTGKALTLGGEGNITLTTAIIGANVGNVTKDGSGMVTLGFAGNTYTGSTTIVGGSLKKGITGNVIPDGSALIVDGPSLVNEDGATYDMNGTVETIGALTVRNGGNVIGGAFTLTAGGPITVERGSISVNLAGSVALTKDAAGTFTLSGADSYTGITTVNDGTLSVFNTTALGLGTAAKLVFTENSNVKTLKINGVAVTLIGLNGDANSIVENAANTSVLTVNTASGAEDVFSGVLRDNGGTLALSKLLNTGTLTLGGSNEYSGATTLSSGTLKLGASDRIADSSTLTISGAGTVFDMQGFNETLGAVTLTAGTISGTGSATLTSTNSFTVSAGTVDAILAGVGIGLTKSTTGNVYLNKANTFSGDTAYPATTGVLTLGNPLALQNSTLQLASGSLNFGLLTEATLGGLNGTTAITNAGAITLSVGNNGASTTYSGAMANGALTKIGTGTLTLSAVQGYAGNTTVNNGTLKLGAQDVIPNSAGKGNVVVDAPGILDLNGNRDTINGLSGSGIIDNAGGINKVLTIGDAGGAGTFSGVMRNSGSYTLSLVKIGGGTISLTGTTSTYTGSTTVQDGALEVAKLANRNSSSSIGAPAGGYAITLGAGTTNATLRYVGTGDSTTERNVDLAGTTGGARLEVAGTGNLTFNSASSAFTASGVGAKTLTLAGSGPGVGTIEKVITNSTSGATSLVKDGAGEWVLNGINSYTGSTTVSNGTLLVNNPGSLAASSTVAVKNTGALGGDGTCLGAVTVENGGAVVPGNHGVGTLTVGGLQLDSGSVLSFQLDAIPGDDDVIDASAGATTISGGGFNLYDASLGSAFSEDGVYRLIRYSGAAPSVAGLSVLTSLGAKDHQFKAADGWVSLAISAGAIISIDDPSMDEGDSGEADLTFTVSLKSAAAGDVSVDWQTSDGTAKSGRNDYTPASGTVHFSTGESSKPVVVKVTGDTKNEANETLVVTLSNATGGEILDATGTGTINDNEGFTQWHVDADATGNNDGYNWEDAFTTLQAAQAAASSGQAIWVAEGTYKPAQATNYFTLGAGIELYGGFVGTESALADRVDPTLHPAVLSGDINGNNQADYATPIRLDCQKVLLISGANTVVDGFTFKHVADVNAYGTSASATGGGAVRIVAGGPITIRKCTFTESWGGYGAAGIVTYNTAYTWTGNLVVENCRFYGNDRDSVNGKGNMCGYFRSGHTTYIRNSVFAGNECQNGDDSGAFMSHSQAVYLENSIIYQPEQVPGYDNTQDYESVYGGGFKAVKSTVKLYNDCVVSGFQSAYGSWEYASVDGLNGLVELTGVQTPGFVNAAGVDFRLAGGSLCLDAGDDTRDADTDIRGTTRAVGMGTDIGAYEMQPFYTNLVATAPAGLFAYGGEVYTNLTVATNVVETAVTMYAYAQTNVDGNTRWIPTNWVDGVGQDAAGSTKSFSVSQDTNFTCQFRTEFKVALAKFPSAGGTVTMAGGAGPVWIASNATVALNADANAADDYHFAGWYDKGNTLLSTETDYVYTVTGWQNITGKFTTVASVKVVTVRTDPAGLTNVVDAVDCPDGSEAFTWDNPSSHDLGATSPQYLSATRRAVFNRWYDVAADEELSGDASFTYDVFDEVTTTVQSEFHTEWALTLATNPAAGGTITGGAGWYDHAAEASVTAAANAGYTFTGWSGDVGAADTNSLAIAVTMDQARTLTANYSRVWFVVSGATGSGAAWGNATTLTNALYNAAGGDQVWVKAGTHLPGALAASVFRLKPNVAVYGGFAGTENNTQFALRDWTANETILSGNNVSKVVNANNATNAIIDGFTITAGTGVSGPGLTKTTATTPLTIRHCKFANNTGTGSSYGGAMQVNGPVTVSSCQFVSNSATHRGAAVCGWASSSSGTLLFENCLFWNNTGSRQLLTYTSITVANCTFYSTTDRAIEMNGDGYWANMHIYNSILWSSMGDDTVVMHTDSSAYGNIDHCIMKNTTDNKGHVYSDASNLTGDPLFADAAAGDLRIAYGSPGIEAGTASGAPATDYAALGRPQDGDNSGTAQYDIGAYEYQFQWRCTLTAASEGGLGTEYMNPANGMVATNGSGSITFTAAPDTASGFIMDRWEDPSGVTVQTGGGTYTLNSVAGNHDVLVYYRPSGIPVTINTSPSGKNLTFTADGTTYTNSKLFGAWLNNEGHALNATPTVQTPADGNQYTFSSWTSGGGASKTYTVPGGSGPYTETATFTTKYGLTVVAGQGGSITTPSGAFPQFYTPDAVVSIVASPASGYLFAGWTGATVADAASASTTITMDSGPKTVTATFANVIHVDGGQSVNGDGISWGTAYNNLVDALAAATIASGNGDAVEVWVKGGYTYKPALSSGKFTISANVGLYGGFAGTELARAARVDPTLIPATLSGDVNNNGTADAGDCPKLVECVGSGAVLDGFTVSKSYSAGSSGGGDLKGGGVRILSDNVTVRNCLLKGNKADYGAAMGCNGSYTGLLVENCVFYANLGKSSAAYCLDANATFRNCTFAGNDPSGNGSFQVYNGTMTLENCILWDDITPLDTGNHWPGGFKNNELHPGIVNAYNCCVRYGWNGFTIPDPQPGSQGTPHGTMVSADPLFADFNNGDLRLKAGSSCHNAGDPARDPAADTRGVARSGTAPDIGAYEGTVYAVSVTPSIAGRTVVFDGQNITAATTVYKDDGGTYTASAVSPEGNSGSRYLLTRWNLDSGADVTDATIDVPINSADHALVATFVQQYQLSLGVSGSGSVLVNNGVDVEWYDAGVSLELKPMAASRWEFTGWTGALTGQNDPETLIMNAAKTVTAVFGVSGPTVIMFQ